DALAQGGGEQHARVLRQPQQLRRQRPADPEHGGGGVPAVVRVAVGGDLRRQRVVVAQVVEAERLRSGEDGGAAPQLQGEGLRGERGVGGEEQGERREGGRSHTARSTAHGWICHR